MNRTARTKSKSPLPPPTASEAAFERAFAAFVGDVVIPSAGERSEAQSKGEVASFVEHAFAHAKEYAEDRYATIGGASQFHTKLVGVSFEGRQDTIAGLRVDTELVLERQPANEFDPNAIGVYYGALQLGFVRKQIAKHLAPLIDGGARYRARVESLTGGGEKNRGVNIYMWRDVEAA
ncbi:MAG TPA: HIRAN domain-containing protein, partial [Verrucomicrobiae bacterium]|nr:HIRAN domain-containing protein [Verrucomicrobiae bacterium]